MDVVVVMVVVVKRKRGGGSRDFGDCDGGTVAMRRAREGNKKIREEKAIKSQAYNQPSCLSHVMSSYGASGTCGTCRLKLLLCTRR